MHKPNTKGTKMQPPHPDIAEVVLAPDQIEEIVQSLGARITQDYEGTQPLLVCILKGASPFMSDLMRSIALDMDIDFMSVSSYGNATTASGTVKILKDLDTPIKDRDVIIVEDIVDSGLTLARLTDELAKRGPRSIEIAAFLLKDVQAPRKVEIKPRYAGFTIDDRFVVGYGLDYAEKYRNLPYVGVLKREVYENNI